MTIWTFLKLLWDSKMLAVFPGWGALVAVGYLQLFHVEPLKAEVLGVKEAVELLQQAQLEERLDATYAALCMNRGDQQLIERIRDLQQQYERVSKSRYTPPDCDLLMKIR